MGFIAWELIQQIGQEIDILMTDLVGGNLPFNEK